MREQGVGSVVVVDGEQAVGIFTERDLVRLASAGAYRVKIARHRLDAAVGQLDSLSPLAVLGRGYSLTRLLPSGAIVRSAAQTRPGDAIEILLRQGALDARVERLKERDDRPQV